MQRKQQVAESNPAREWSALQEGTGAVIVADRALLRVTGTDSTRWLNGMVTNSVTALPPGGGAYSFFLNAQGRIQGDCTLYREPISDESASFLLSTTAVQVDTLQPWLDRYIIMDEVEITRIFTEEASLLLAGPGVETALRTVALPLPESLKLLHADTPEGPVRLFTPAPARVPKVELRADTSLIATLRSKLVAAGVVEISPQTLEAWRVFEGTPLFGTDIRDRDLPQETGQEHALHFAKGCYLGQEIVERIRSRGQVHRSFTRFELNGEPPVSLPVKLEADGKPAGEITSVANITSPQGPRRLALGYGRRDLLSSEVALTYAGGTAQPLSTRS